jgi:hypothetical protein
MKQPVETLSFENGLHAEIHHDPDVEQPYPDDDGVRIVVLHRRYMDPSKGACGRDPEEVAEWERENAQQWFTIPLFLYDHSGTIYRVGQTNPFHCPWDSGRVGIVALKPSDWGDGRPTDSQLTGYAEAVAETYTAWANGECYGYVLRDASGNELGSCWGYIGRETAIAEARAAACSHLRGETGGSP